MTDYNLVEEYFIKVNKLFAGNYFVQGKRLLEDILEIEPAYGRAHNHLGWLYYAKLDDYGKAEFHYRLAKKFAPDYAAAYINLSYLLVDTKRFEEAKLNASEGLLVPEMNLSCLHNELGRIEEFTGNYKPAMKHYLDAIRLGMNKNELDVYNANFTRAKNKLKLFDRKFLFF